MLSGIAAGYIAANPGQDGNATGKRDRNAAALAWLGAQGVTVPMDSVAAGITADSVLIGGASAQASADGQDDADTGDWSPGDSKTAAEAAAGLGLSSLPDGSGGAGGEPPDTAGDMEDGYLGVVSRTLAGWDGAGGEDEGDLGDALADAVADPDFAAGLTLNQVVMVAGLAALQWYLAQDVRLVQWVAEGQNPCPVCITNSRADPRPPGTPWPSGAISTPQHPMCRCSLASALPSRAERRTVPEDLPQDPVSVLAAGAAQLHELFTAYVDAGFTRPEALQIVIGIIRPQQG